MINSNFIATGLYLFDTALITNVVFQVLHFFVTT